jgi:hypothetical protein
VEELTTCPSCGARTPAGLGVCIECFSSVDGPADAAIAQPTAPLATLPAPADAGARCCGQPLSADAARCPYCDEPRPADATSPVGAAQHTLVFPHGRVVEIDPQEPVQIGREVGSGPGAALDYPNNVSRRHAEVAATSAGGLHVTDLASANGTFLNGSRLQPNVPALARPGDRIRFAANFEAVVAEHEERP